MKASALHAVWSAPDNSRLTAKQYSFRLPVHVAAKVSALCDMYPSKTRTQIVGDLLSAALQDVEDSFRPVLGRPFGDIEEDGEQLYEDVGLHGTFATKANEFAAELELELGNEPTAVVPTRLVLRSDCKP